MIRYVAFFKCPEDTRPLIGASGQFARSYSFNGALPSKIIQASSSSQTVMLAEWYTGVSGPGGAASNFQYQASFDAVIYSVGGIPSARNSSGYHGSLSNFIFTDGHAESLNPNQTVVAPSMWTSIQ